MGASTARPAAALGRIQDVAALVRLHEGTGPMRAGRHLPYQDSLGLLTIGYGRLLARGLSTREADLLLYADLSDIISELREALPWFDQLDEVRRAVLIDMGMMGTPRLLGFRRMLVALARGDYAMAAREMLDSKWARQVKSRARQDAAMMRSGQWP